jgi:hypothetical protein
MHNGLFVIRYNSKVGLTEKGRHSLSAKVSPNPTLSSVNIHIISNYAEKAQIQLYNLSGQLLVQKQIDLVDGENDIKLEEVSGVEKGMYIMRMISESGLSAQLSIVKY